MQQATIVISGLNESVQMPLCILINNGIFNKSFADKFLNEVLSLGGSKNFEEVYESFSNKKVDNNCLLKLLWN